MVNREETLDNISGLFFFSTFLLFSLSQPSFFLLFFPQIYHVSAIFWYILLPFIILYLNLWVAFFASLHFSIYVSLMLLELIIPKTRLIAIQFENHLCFVIKKNDCNYSIIIAIIIIGEEYFWVQDDWIDFKLWFVMTNMRNWQVLLIYFVYNVYQVLEGT